VLDYRHVQEIFIKQCSIDYAHDVLS